MHSPEKTGLRVRHRGRMNDPAYRLARVGELAVGECRLVGLSQRDQGNTVESEFSLAALDHEPPNPALGPGLLDVEVDSVAVTVSSRRGRAHEGGRKPLVGMAALGLGLRRVVAELVTFQS